MLLRRPRPPSLFSQLCGCAVGDAGEFNPLEKKKKKKKKTTAAEVVSPQRLENPSQLYDS